MKCSLFWSVKKFSWAYIPCLLVFHFTQPGVQPWNPTTKCKITGQSKLHIPNLNALTVLTRHSQASQCMLSFLPTLLPRSCSLLMQIPTRRTLGFILSVQIMKEDISSFGLMELARLCEIVLWPIFAETWALVVHIWKNPPAHLESGSVQCVQPCFNWPVPKQLTNRIMHHFLWLSKQQMDSIIICIGQFRKQL